MYIYIYTYIYTLLYHYATVSVLVFTSSRWFRTLVSQRLSRKFCTVEDLRRAFAKSCAKGFAKGFSKRLYGNSQCPGGGG